MYSLLLFLHILGACTWAGGHLILLFAILPEAKRNQSTEYLLRFEKNYERIGIPALFTQLVTGAILFFRLLPADDISISHPVVQKLYIKLVLLALTFAFAIHAKFFVLKNFTVEKLPVMHWHIAGVTILSLLFILAGINFKYTLF